MVEEKKKPTGDESTLDIARKRFARAGDAEDHNRRGYIEDTTFSCSDDMWTEEVKRARGKDRPALTFNRLNGVVKQIIGDYRQNKMAIKVLPGDGHASEKTAEVLAGIVRNIEAQSNADVAYVNALECAARGGFGYFRILTEYCGDDVFDQDIVIRPIHNPLTVYIDPAAKLITREDANWAFITEIIPKEEFERKYPEAKSQGFEGGDDMLDWLSEDGIRVAEYYEKKTYTARLAALSNGMVIEIKDDAELEALAQIGITVTSEREADRTKVIWRRITGAEVLETREYKTKYIPIVPVIGEEVNVEGKVLIRSAIYYAKDAQRMYNYHKTAATEATALATKAPWLVTPTQIENFQDIWDSANTSPIPYLPYNPDPTAGPPQRIEPANQPIGEMAMAAGAAQDLQYTTGVFDANLGSQGGKELSGVALGERQSQGATSTYIFTDNLKSAIEYGGKIILSMIPEHYDTERVIRLLDLEGNPKTETINKRVFDPLTGVTNILNSVTVGKYDVIISTGPSFASRRREALEAMLKIAAIDPVVMQTSRDIIVKNIDAPGMDEVASRLERTVPKEIRIDPESEEGKMMAAEAANKPPPVPPEVLAAQAESEKDMKEIELKHQAKMQEIAANAALQREQAAQEMMLERERHENDMQLKREARRAELDDNVMARKEAREHEVSVGKMLKPEDYEDEVKEVAEAVQQLAAVTAQGQQNTMQIMQAIAQQTAQTTAVLAEGINRQADALNHLAEVNAAPREAVVDPKTGKIIGSKIKGA